MSVKELQKYTYFSKYARYNKEAKRRETWEEAVDRMKQMHLRRYPQVANEINWAFEYIRDQKVLGSQRALQYGGHPIEQKNARIYNCITSYCDRLRFFQEAFWLLLCGSGTGFSVQNHHIAKLPAFSDLRNFQSLEHPRFETKTYVVPDTIEGWGDSLGVLLSSYFADPVFPEYANCHVEFDVSLVRTKGSLLSSGAGKAPGPEPLVNSLEKIRKLLDRCIADGQTRLRSIDAYDIVMHASDAVLSGGVRRCLAAGTKVLVKEIGYKNIEDICVGDMVSTMNGYRRVTNVFDQGKQETLSIKHANGTLTCTPNHRIAVLKNHKGQYDWKKAHELTDKDVLILPKNVDPGSENVSLPKCNYTKQPHSATCKDIAIPCFDSNIAYFIGLFLGDGCVSLNSETGSISVTTEYKTIAQKAKEQIERFGFDAQITGPWENDNCFKVFCESKQLAKYFYDNFKQPATSIKVPSCIWASSPSHKFAFLQGLLDSDGSVKSRPQQAICTVYKEFVQDVQRLYATLGMSTSIKKLSVGSEQPNKQQRYAVVVLDDRVKIKFNELNNEIGEKKYALSTKFRRSQPRIPLECISEPYPKNWHSKVCASDTLVPIATVEEFFGELDYTPVRIISVVPNSIMHTYDIEVDDQHCFVAEQVLVHNSATICIFSDDDNEMLAAKTGNWFYTEPQRARSNNSVMLIRGKTTRERFMEIINSVKQFGEPGFVWSDSTEMMLNPCCFDPDTRIATKNGLVRIEDLYENGTENTVISDTRVGTGDVYCADKFGVIPRPASKAILTQKSAELYEVVTEHGNVIRVTANHKFPTVSQGRRELRDLTFGDKILLQSGQGQFGDTGTYNHGLIAGLVTGDGIVCGEDTFIDVWEEDFYSLDAIRNIVNFMPEVEKSCNPCKWVNQKPSINGIKKKRIGGTQLREVLENVGIEPAKLKSNVPESIWRGTRSMVAGYLHGVIFSIGSIQYTDRGKKSSLTLRITQDNKSLLEEIQALLLNFSIVSRMCHRTGPRMMPNGRGGLSSYECADVYELIVNRANLIRFMDNVGLFGRKQERTQALLQAMDCLRQKPERFTTKIKSIKSIGCKDVYCLEEPETNCLIGNGVVTGNCEIGMYPVDEVTGKTGWQACNLSEINGKMVTSREDFCMAAIAASIVGTLQAGYDEFAYLGEISERIVRREALLGVSITGMMDSSEVLFNPEFQKMAAELVSHTNTVIAEKIGIKPAARTTCTKPSGCLDSNTTIKTTQGNMSLLNIFKEQGYDLELTQNMKDEWLEIKKPLVIMNENNEPEKVVKLYVNGNADVCEISLEDGTVVKSTPCHKFKLVDGSWKRADELKENDDILSY
jgi:ribonucleotide reductase class II